MRRQREGAAHIATEEKDPMDAMRGQPRRRPERTAHPFLCQSVRLSVRLLAGFANSRGRELRQRCCCHSSPKQLARCGAGELLRELSANFCALTNFFPCAFLPLHCKHRVTRKNHNRNHITTRPPVCLSFNVSQSNQPMIVPSHYKSVLLQLAM